jgi:hypothetical protein
MKSGEAKMSSTVQLLDAVALIEDLPEHNLRKGQVGTVVEELAPEVFEVEFVNNQGRTYALQPCRADQLLVLYYEPALAA